jgi:hypothetical protein
LRSDHEAGEIPAAEQKAPNATTMMTCNSNWLRPSRREAASVKIQHLLLIDGALNVDVIFSMEH